jgi:glycerol-3-phosphate acyltransferase PlsX
MGSYYTELALGVARPRVALLNNGTESTKGTPLQIETYKLLAQAGDAVNFVGNVEGGAVMTGLCDVVVCDGFSGNILLKGVEGASKFVLGEIKSAFMKSAKTKLSALLLKSEIAALRETFNADRIGGTVLLGISKTVVKAHGSSGADAIFGAVRQAARAAEVNVSGKLKENVERMKLEPERDAAP